MPWKGRLYAGSEAGVAGACGSVDWATGSRTTAYCTRRPAGASTASQLAALGGLLDLVVTLVNHGPCLMHRQGLQAPSNKGIVTLRSPGQTPARQGIMHD